jgi:hypothetical protein
MPTAVIEDGVVDLIVPLHRIAATLTGIVGAGPPTTARLPT